jgi:hypothetical protein
MARQLRIAGTERPRFKEIDSAAERYQEARQEATHAKDVEAKAKESLVATMKRHGVSEYLDQDAIPPLLITVETGPDKVKVTERHLRSAADPEAEAAADRILEGAGAGELNDPSLKGDAVAKIKGRSSEVAAAVKGFRDALPEGTRVTVPNPLEDAELETAQLRRELAEARRELERALRPPTFTELAALKATLDPIRVSATESLDNIARRLVREERNLRIERAEWQAKHAGAVKHAEILEENLEEERDVVEVTRAKVDGLEAEGRQLREQRQVEQLRADLAEQKAAELTAQIPVALAPVLARDGSQTVELNEEDWGRLRELSAVKEHTASLLEEPSHG